MSDMDLKALEIFRTVVAEGSVSKAAVKLNRVQSNISTRIKQLETQLEKKLFLRQNRQMTLTSDGEILLSYADKLIELSHEARNALRGEVLHGTLRIGAMESTAAARLPKLLHRYSEAYPDVHIELLTDTAGGLITRLQKNQIEAAFVAEPVFVEKVKTQPVFEENLVLIVPNSYGPINSFQSLNGKTLVGFEIGCAYRRYLEKWLLEMDVIPGSTMSVSSYLAIFACVAAGTGFAIAPQSVLDIVLTDSQFQQYSLFKSLKPIKTMLAWKESNNSVKLNSFKAFLPLIAAA